MHYTTDHRRIGLDGSAELWQDWLLRTIRRAQGAPLLCAREKVYRSDIMKKPIVAAARTAVRLVSTAYRSTRSRPRVESSGWKGSSRSYAVAFTARSPC